jgi:hypothetical protein
MGLENGDALAAASVAQGFDVASQAPLGGHILNVADGQPHLAGAHSGREGLVGGAPTGPGQNQGAAQDPGIASPEFVVHKPPIVTDPHQ